MKQKRLILSVLVAGLVAIGASSLAVNRPAYAVDPPSCAVLPQSTCNASNEQDPKKSGVTQVLTFALTILTAFVGVAAVGAFVYAGVLYSSASGKSEQVVKAKKLMFDTTIGLVVYAAVYLAIRWLLPGDIIG